MEGEGEILNVKNRSVMQGKLSKILPSLKNSFQKQLAKIPKAIRYGGACKSG